MLLSAWTIYLRCTSSWWGSYSFRSHCPVSCTVWCVQHASAVMYSAMTGWICVSKWSLNQVFISSGHFPEFPSVCLQVHSSSESLWWRRKTGDRLFSRCGAVLPVKWVANAGPAQHFILVCVATIDRIKHQFLPASSCSCQDPAPSLLCPLQLVYMTLNLPPSTVSRW